MKVIIEEDKIKIFVIQKLFSFSKNQEQNLKKIIDFVKKNYHLKYEQIYFIKIYHDKNYGCLIEIYPNLEKDFFYLDDDISVQIIETNFKFKVDDDYQFFYLKKIKPVITLDEKMSNMDLGLLLEHTTNIIVADKDYLK